VRICRAIVDDELFFGLIEGEAVVLLQGHPFGELSPEGRVLPLEEVRLVAPVLPSKIIAVGRNYAEHARELGNEVPVAPMIFLKPSTCVIGPGEPITLPWQSEQVEHEAELAVVIGRLCRDVPEDRVPEVILGFTCANDVTARDLQRTDGQWGRAKGFDSFCPLGPWIETSIDLDDADVTCLVNGQVRQSGSTGDMVRDVVELVSWISSVMTLLPGDVILTGTPAGVGPLVAGDSVSVSIDGIGTLTNPVVDRD
jgi:2-keto-4-pentenoate hydratase/2-oxohepta-3-ene-1,7-dioic acid hydratase in catechol pathway